MLDKVLDAVDDYVRRDDTRATLQARVVQPAMKFLGERLGWCVWVFQAVAVLVLLQTVILVWLLVREARRAP